MQKVLPKSNPMLNLIVWIGFCFQSCCSAIPKLKYIWGVYGASVSAPHAFYSLTLSTEAKLEVFKNKNHKKITQRVPVIFLKYEIIKNNIIFFKKLLLYQL